MKHGSLILLTVLLLLPGAFAGAATLTVDTTVDEFDTTPNATCSLREAVESANNDTDFGGCIGDGVYGDDTILLPAGTYGLTQGPTEPFLELDNSVGDLDVGFLDIFVGVRERLRSTTEDRGIFALDSLEILGEGAGTTIIDRASAETFGIFQVAPPTVLRLVDVTVTGGEQIAGGGIFAAFELELERVVVRDNVARAPDAGGGGIVALDFLTLVDTLVTGNEVFLEDPCDFGPDSTGGGIFAFPFELLIESSTISNNVVTGDPGCEGFGGGLGLLTEGFPTRIVNSTFSGNSAPYAGGIDLLVESFFFFPEPGPGPDPLTAPPRLGNRPVKAPTWGRDVSSAALRLEHGIIPGPEPEPVFFEHVTIADNSATDVGGLSIISFDESGEVVLENTLIGDNTAADAPDCTLFGADVTSQGTNLLSIDDPFDDGEGGTDDVCLTQPPDLVGTLAEPLDPVLGPLQNNGGETPTHALLGGSPAFDAAPDQGETEDQRGVARPQGAAFDIGAFEADAADLFITKTAETMGSQIVFTVTVTNFGPLDAIDVVIEDPLPAGLAFVSASPSAGGMCTTPAVGEQGGTVTCTFAGATAPDMQRTVVITTMSTQGIVGPNTATASSTTGDPIPDPSPNMATVAVMAVGIPTLGEWSLLLLVLSLMGTGVWWLRH